MDIYVVRRLAVGIGWLIALAVIYATPLWLTRALVWLDSALTTAGL